MLKFIRTYGRTKSRNMDISIMENNQYLKETIPIDKLNIHLEIGFGNGENIIHRSKLLPESLQVGIDVYKNGICKVLKYINITNTKNIILLNKDVRELLNENLNFRIDYLYIMFPDPWHKKSEKKRLKKRLINLDFLQKILIHVEKNGHFIFASDHKDYCDDIKTHMEKFINFNLISETMNAYPVVNGIINYFVESNYEKKAELPKYYLYYSLSL